MPDGRHFAVGDLNGVVEIYDLTDPTPLHASEWLPEEDCLEEDTSYDAEFYFGPGERCRTHSTTSEKRLERLTDIGVHSS